MDTDNLEILWIYPIQSNEKEAWKLLDTCRHNDCLDATIFSLINWFIQIYIIQSVDLAKLTRLVKYSCSPMKFQIDLIE